MTLTAACPSRHLNCTSHLPPFLRQVPAPATVTCGLTEDLHLCAPPSSPAISPANLSCASHRTFCHLHLPVSLAPLKGELSPTHTYRPCLPATLATFYWAPTYPLSLTLSTFQPLQSLSFATLLSLPPPSSFLGNHLPPSPASHTCESLLRSSFAGTRICYLRAHRSTPLAGSPATFSGVLTC